MPNSIAILDWRSLHGDAFAGQRVLVTGGAGFIGSHLVEALVSLGARVVALDDCCGGDWKNLEGFGQDVEKITASLLDEGALAGAVKGCRVVFHQAALGSVPRSLVEPRLYFQVNVMGTLNLLEAARGAGVARLVYAGSSSAYGDRTGPGPNAGPVAKVESMSPLPLSPYAATKLAGECACQAWAGAYGLDTAVLRYFNIFGPRQNPFSPYSAVMAAFAKALHGARPATIYGDGEQSRDFTYVANAVQANLLAARCPAPLLGQVFNVACSAAVSVNEIYRRMAQAFGRPDLKPLYAPGRSGEVRHSLADIRRAQEVLGYKPLVDLQAGLARTVEWYRGHLKKV